MNSTKILCVAASVALLGATSCKKNDADDGKKTASTSAGKTTTTPDTKPDTPAKWTSADSLKAFAKCGEGFNSHDPSKACFTGKSKFTMIDWVGPSMDLAGAAVEKAMTDYWKAFPDIKGTPQLVLANGNKVAAIGLDEGTHTGEMNGMPPTNKKISMFSAMISTFAADGSIEHQWNMSDQGTWSHQLGMFPNPTAPASEKPWAKPIMVAASDADKAKIDANVAIVKNLEAASGKGDLDTIKAHLADDATFRYVPMANAINGAEAYMAGMKQWGGMFESMDRTVKEAWGAGDWVVALVSNKVKLGEIPNPKKASTKGKEVTTSQIAFYKIADSKVVNHWVFENSYSFAVQAGLADPPPAMPAAGKKDEMKHMGKDMPAPKKGDKK